MRIPLFPRKKSVITVSITDLAVWTYLLFAVLHIGVVSGFRCDPWVWYKWGVAFCVYGLVRNLGNKKLVLCAIVGFGLIQAIVAIGQYLSLVSGSHDFFNVCGWFDNPGPLGGCLAVALMGSLGFWGNKSTCVVSGILATGLYLSDSRAAFLSVAVGLMVLFSDKLIALFKKHKIAIVAVFFGLITSGIGLYFYRPASANARLLIWQVSAKMIADKPIGGHGVGAFDQEYMLYQADYFEHHPQSPFTLVAGNTFFPYNELVHVWIELGIIGFLLLIAIFGAALSNKSQDRTDRTLKAGLVAFIVFSLFSYPAGVALLLILGACLLGTLPGKTVRQFGTIQLKYMRYASTVCFLTIAVFLFVQGNRQSSDASSKTEHIRLSSEKYCALGQAYERCGQYDKAEKVYTTASYMIPSRVLPNYYLWKLYLKQGNQKQACNMAQKILTQPVKIENTQTLRIKGQMMQFLSEQI